jgi:hypothetical protein
MMNGRYLLSPLKLGYKPNLSELSGYFYTMIEIIDKDGWRKAFRLGKTITHVGSAPHNDIVLENWRGSGVEPRHLQLIALPQGYRLVNLGSASISLIDSDTVIPSRSSAQVDAGAIIRVGEFTLTFYEEARTAAPSPLPVPRRETGGEGQAARPSFPLPQPSPQVGRGAPAKDEAHTVPAPQPSTLAEEVAPPKPSTSDVIGVDLSLSGTELGPNSPIEGVIKVRNLGDQTGVQFKLAVEGLAAENYSIGPGPILFPNAEREVPLRLYHPQKPDPLAGEHRIQIHATAPNEYPGERATASQVIQILPFYRHRLRILNGE